MTQSDKASGEKLLNTGVVVVHGGDLVASAVVGAANQARACHGPEEVEPPQRSEEERPS